MPLGKAAVARPGEALTILAYGTMVHVCQSVVEEAGVDVNSRTATGVLVAVVLAGVAVVLLGLEGTVPVVGAVPPGLPAVGLPSVTLLDLVALFPTAVAIALISFADTIVISRAFAARRGERVRSERELAAPAGRLDLDPEPLRILRDPRRADLGLPTRPIRDHAGPGGASGVREPGGARIIEVHDRDRRPRGEPSRCAALAPPGTEPLEVVEVQTGDYLEEDDITRYEDIYARV